MVGAAEFGSPKRFGSSLLNMGLLPNLSVCHGFQFSVVGDVTGLGSTSKENSYVTSYSKCGACYVRVRFTL